MQPGWDRRSFMRGAAILAPLLGISTSAIWLTGCTANDTPSKRQTQLFRIVCQLVIPKSETLGAGDVGVGEFVLLALAHGLDGTDGPLNYVTWLESRLDEAAQGDFLKLYSAKQGSTLAAIDAAAFPAGPPPKVPSPWVKIKGLILIGYYTSEVGGSKELQYELVPGRWEPIVPLKPGDRAWSSDWTAVDFG